MAERELRIVEVGASTSGGGAESVFDHVEPSVETVTEHEQALERVRSDELDCLVYTGAFDDDAVEFVREVRDISSTVPIVAVENPNRTPSVPAIRRADGVSSTRDDAFVEGILDLIPDAFYMLDLNGYITHWNDRIEEITGYTAEEIEGLHALDFVPDEDEKFISDAIFRVFNEGDVETVESALVTKDGEAIPYELNAVRVRDDDGGVIGLVGTGRRITERKDHARRLRELHEAARRFIAAESADDVHGVVVDTCDRVLSMSRMCLYVPDEEELAMVPVACTDEFPNSFESMPELPIGQSLVGAVYRSKRSQLYRTMDGIQPYVTDADVESALVVPVGERGVLLAVSPRRNRFDESDQEFVEMVAADAAAALERC